MITPQNNRLIKWFFHHYILKLVRRNFERVNFEGINFDNTKPLLLIANHFSWWDGFILYYLNHKLLKKRFHVMVIEETARRVSFMKYMGAFSVSKNTKGIIESLNYAAELLADSRNMVVIFPQGKIHSNFTSDIEIQKGVIRILEKSGRNTQTIFSACFIEHLKFKKPTVNIYLKAADIAPPYSVQILQQAYQQHYKQALHQQSQIVY